MERVSVVVVGVMIRSLLVVRWLMIWSVSTSPRAFNSKCGMSSGLCCRLQSLKLSVSWGLVAVEDSWEDSPQEELLILGNVGVRRVRSHISLCSCC